MFFRPPHDGQSPKSSNPQQAFSASGYIQFEFRWGTGTQLSLSLFTDRYLQITAIFLKIVTCILILSFNIHLRLQIVQGLDLLLYHSRIWWPSISLRSFTALKWKMAANGEMGLRERKHLPGSTGKITTSVPIIDPGGSRTRSWGATHWNAKIACVVLLEIFVQMVRPHRWRIFGVSTRFNLTYKSLLYVIQNVYKWSISAAVLSRSNPVRI
jgi:hypothetical protein